VLSQFAVKSFVLCARVLILSPGLLSSWPDLLWSLSRVLTSFFRKAAGVTAGLHDRFPSTALCLTMVQTTMTDFISLHGHNITQQKRRSIDVQIDMFKLESLKDQSQSIPKLSHCNLCATGCCYCWPLTVKPCWMGAPLYSFLGDIA